VQRVGALASQPNGVDWPTSTWPRRPNIDVQRCVDVAFTDEARCGPLGKASACGVVVGGELIAEAYGPDATDQSTLLSWSVAKSLTHALVGIAARDGHLDPDAATGLPAWANDDRAAITLQHLMTMTDGLDFSEVYATDRPSDVVEMLFGSGKDDVAAYVLDRPLAHQPGTVSNYSSGSTNVVSRVLRDAIGDASVFAREHLFAPLGMTNATVRLDQTGTFIGSTFAYATLHDWLRFGLLYARDGVWNERRIVPIGWVDRARTTTPSSVGVDYNHYGEGWWVCSDPRLADLGAFTATGYLGQFVMIVPAIDAVIGYFGEVPDDDKTALREHLIQLTLTIAATR
jgi:CubicO group peptidase (beta-lactamase class C family)